MDWISLIFGIIALFASLQCYLLIKQNATDNGVKVFGYFTFLFGLIVGIGFIILGFVDIL